MQKLIFRAWLLAVIATPFFLVFVVPRLNPMTEPQTPTDEQRGLQSKAGDAIRKIVATRLVDAERKVLDAAWLNDTMIWVGVRGVASPDDDATSR